MTNAKLLSRITARPDVFGGKPNIRNMRVSVELVLSLLTQGVTPEAIVDDYPGLELDDIRACTAYAHAVIGKDTPDYRGIAEVFWNGRSQAVRLPAACRFKVSEVEVIKEGDQLTLRPRDKNLRPRDKDWSGYFESDSRGSLPTRREPPLGARVERR